MDETTSSFTRQEGKLLYEQVRGWLREQVTSGRWPVHSMLPPEITIAQELGVSRVTVRLAMKELVEDGTFTRVRGRGTFVALQAEDVQKIRQFPPEKRHETQLIGVVVPYTHTAFVSTVLSHLEHALYNYGYRMLLTNSQDRLSLQRQHLLQLVDFGVAGIILYSGSFLHDETVNTLLKRNIPLVMLDRYYPALTTHLVSSDHLRGAYAMTEYLLQLGHQRIGFLLTRPTEFVTSTFARLEGYKAALKDYNIPFEEDLVMQAQIRDTTVKTYLDRARPTAVFACNDDRAIDFLHILRTLDLHVPTDLTLVGFDDIPLVSRLDPSLTTIAQPIDQLGETAARLLVDTINGHCKLPQTILLPTELIIRQSSAHAPQLVSNIQANSEGNTA